MELKTFKIKFMNKILYTFILLLTTSLAFSQIKMEGLVKDSLNNPLELANVILINKEIDESLAKTINRRFFEIIVAPKYTKEAINILKSKVDEILFINMEK